MLFTKDSKFMICGQELLSKDPVQNLLGKDVCLDLLLYMAVSLLSWCSKSIALIAPISLPLYPTSLAMWFDSFISLTKQAGSISLPPGSLPPSLDMWVSWPWLANVTHIELENTRECFCFHSSTSAITTRNMPEPVCWRIKYRTLWS